jgi:hypothetical protein
MPFRFTGDVPLLYTQYRDLGTDRPLQAVPGGSYDMEPVGGLNLTVPPSDGRWGPPPAPPEAEDEDPEADADDAPADPPPASLTTSVTTEDDEG